MTRQQLTDSMSAYHDQDKSILEAKNKDYGANTNALKNFDYIAKLLEGVDLANCDLVSVGILVRMADKMSRIATLMGKEPSVVGETMSDTLSDLRNYACILAARQEELK